MKAPDKMVIEHTEVDDELRGQNVGYQLVEAAVEYARQHNIKDHRMVSFAKRSLIKTGLAQMCWTNRFYVPNCTA